MFENLFEGKETTIAKDLKLNLIRLSQDGALDRPEALLAILAVATAVEHEPLKSVARAELSKLDVSPDQVREASEVAGIMGMLNIYYRFRHMLGKEEDYRNAGLRMTSLANPVLGKERFEMLAFAVSVINGCENCIRSHEKVLRDTGVSSDRVHDLARLAAVVKGLKYI